MLQALFSYLTLSSEEKLWGNSICRTKLLRKRGSPRSPAARTNSRLISHSHEEDMVPSLQWWGGLGSVFFSFQSSVCLACSLWGGSGSSRLGKASFEAQLQSWYCLGRQKPRVSGALSGRLCHWFPQAVGRYFSGSEELFLCLRWIFSGP